LIIHTHASHPIYNLLPTEIEGFDSLAELALDLRWSWNHTIDHVWRQLDPALWDLPHNPWVVLQTVSRDQIERVLDDPEFRQQMDDLVRTRRQAVEASAWFQHSYPQAPLTCVSYFSMEFMLSEALPIYSGGLGNVAGDQLKVASDLGVSVVGVGLLYQQGYFRQVIGKDGAQDGNNHAYFQDNETDWSGWSDLDQHQGMYRFTRGLTAFRRAHPTLRQEHFYRDAEIHWFGLQGDVPRWTDPKGQTVCSSDSRRSAVCTLPAGQCRYGGG